jgi:small-conductance mechanosensitive channel
MWLGRITETRVLAADTIQLSTRIVIAKVVRAAAVLVAVLIALPLVGIDVTALSVFSGALGVGLGFGLQKIASNYVSGFIVLLDKSLRIGDVITVDGRKGEVKAIESRYTVIRGGDGVESIIPNETLITQSVNHHTYTDPKVSMVVGVSVSYESDIEKARELLLAAAKRQPRVIAEPPAAARVKNLGDNGVDLELTVWIADPAAGEAQLRSELLLEVLRTSGSTGSTSRTRAATCASSLRLKPAKPPQLQRLEGGIREQARGTARRKVQSRTISVPFEDGSCERAHSECSAVS